MEVKQPVEFELGWPAAIVLIIGIVVMAIFFWGTTTGRFVHQERLYTDDAPMSYAPYKTY